MLLRSSKLGGAMAFDKHQDGSYRNALAAERIEVRAPLAAEYLEILTPDAWRFVAELTRTFDDVGAPEIWVTHGREEALIHYATGKGIRARALSLVGREEEGQ